MNLLLEAAYVIDARPSLAGMNATTRFNSDFWTRNEHHAAVAFIEAVPGRVPASRTDSIVQVGKQR